MRLKYCNDLIRHHKFRLYDPLAGATSYNTIQEFNVDSKAEHLALSSTCSQKKETKTNKRQCPFNTVQVKIREGSPRE